MKKVINFVAWAIPVLLLAWFAYTLIQNTKPQLQNKTQEIRVNVNFNNKPDEGSETVETTRQVPVVCPFTGEVKTSKVKSVVKTTKNEPSERKVVITEDAFKATMREVAYTAHQQAKSEYDKNFSTLLTILTIFGIAWPVIIALLQFKFNENELNKIKQAQNDAQDAIKKTEEAFNNHQKTIDIIKQLSSVTQNAYNDTLKRIQILFDTNSICFNSMALGNIDFSDYYNILSLRCSVWSIQATQELGVSEETLKNVIKDAHLITPKYKNYNLTKNSYKMLSKIREDLKNKIAISGKNFELLMQLCSLLDEKIAEYEKLLAATDSDKQ